MEEQTGAPIDVEQVLSEPSSSERSLRIAFQPVCDLKSREVIGYEALARFPGWAITTPRQWFEQAIELGLQQALELLAATTAIEQLVRLEPHAFLSVNLSPATAASKAFADLASNVPSDRLDAGAADVGLQHLLEIRPDIVKIDTTVIHGIADDELRQAVAIAYASLSRRAGAISLAEGIETEAELTMLSSLEVEAGQGYLLGRPALLAD